MNMLPRTLTVGIIVWLCQFTPVSAVVILPDLSDEFTMLSVATHPFVYSGTSLSGVFAGDDAFDRARYGLIYYDTSGFVSDLNSASAITLKFGLSAITGTPSPLRVDYIGTFTASEAASAPTSLQFDATALYSFATPVDNTSTNSTVYSVDVTPIKADSFASQYAAFRFYQSSYLTDGGSQDSYILSPDNLEVTPEPGRVMLLMAGLLGIALRRRRVNAARQ